MTDNIIEAPQQAVLEDSDDKVEFELTPLVTDIMSKYDNAKRARLETEQRWVKAYYNFRGIYNKNVKFTETEKSRVFIKITKTKVQAAYGQLLEILFANGKLPISIQPTPQPINIEETVHFDPRDPKQENNNAEVEQQVDPFGFEGDGNPLEAGDTLTSRIGKAVAKLFEGAKPKSGPADEAEERQISPAEVSARKMEKKILDQLTESNAVNHLCSTLFEMVLLGSGVIKGPFVSEKEYPKWDEKGEYTPIVKVVPEVTHVSLWNSYPDPSAKNKDDLEYFIERHRLSASELRKLKRMPYFRKKVIDEVVEIGPTFENLWWESELSERNRSDNENRYEVIEYWGTVDTDFVADELNSDLPIELRDEEELQINCWIVNGRIIRLVLNPFKPKRIPYHISHYETDPYNFFGIGLAENMEDTQTLMNGFARLAIDNAVLAGNIMLEVDETNLVPGQNMSIYAGKIWRRQGGAPGQAIFATKFPNTANENLQMFDKFRVLADEATGIPSFSHGQTGVTGVGRTAAGISMLLGAASLQTKTVIKNIDNNLLQPLGEAMFAFNMQFDFDEDIVGDLEVKARGTSSLMQKEVKSQRLIQLLQVSVQPTFAPFVNYEELLREIVISLDLDSEKLLLDPKKAAIQLKLMAQANEALQPQQQQQQQTEQPLSNAPQQTNGITPPSDQTGGGGGNIGVGAPALPNTEQFTNGGQ